MSNDDLSYLPVPPESPDATSFISFRDGDVPLLELAPSTPQINVSLDQAIVTDADGKWSHEFISQILIARARRSIAR